MFNIKKKFSIFFLAVIIFIGSFFYFYNKVYLSVGRAVEKKTVLVELGDNALVVGEKLDKAGVISGKYYLAFYLWRTGHLHALTAGVYDFTPELKIPEIARIITGGEVASTRVPITFPEGWTAKQVAARLDVNGFSGNDFLLLVNAPPTELKDKYPFLKEIPAGKSLEGYLFPDTYYFAKDASVQDILDKMLKNFDAKISPELLSEIDAQKKSLYEILTMASIVEGEVQNDADRKIVAGLFWNRIAIGMTLGSDATLEYVLGTNDKQHSIAQTKIDSPYNTYVYKGLPPGPVSNPSLAAILATINPAKTDFVYFLSDPKTGKTIFSKTFEEHVANKSKYGL
jgi:UPF0755 protein